jgi:hypothetical protein
MNEIPVDEPLALLAEAFGTDARYPAPPHADGQASAEPAAGATSPAIAAAARVARFDGERGAARTV